MTTKNTILVAIGVLCGAGSLAMAETHVGIGFSFGAPAPIVVRRAPPARVVERVAVSPGPGYVWISGHYAWAGNRWIWMSGSWVIPPRPDARWVDGVWSPQTQQWVDAHWELPATLPPPPPAPTVVVPASPAPGTVPSEVVVEEAPPAPVQEVIVTSPGPDYIWVGGYWGWERGHRIWVRGRWERPPHGYRSWVAPRWEHRSHGYVYVHGYWH